MNEQTRKMDKERVRTEVRLVLAYLNLPSFSSLTRGTPDFHLAVYDRDGARAHRYPAAAYRDQVWRFRVFKVAAVRSYLLC
jgi:hypothetical protein